MIQTAKKIFRRELEKLKLEIELYTDENKIWIVDNKISNSAGNLCLHLIGNLNTYIGAQLGNTGYVRQRDLEFSLKNVSRNELIAKVDQTITIIEKALNSLKEEQVHQIHPFQIFEEKTTLEFLLVHLMTHLTYHLGQVNYHRRLLDNIK